ncbi:MAG: response regulator [Candidatus Auribacterota bacterium]|jgi:CheY-like chemotaxis protein|nr:response regulator [Candidatus Auribacterota bacterium]
MYPKILIVEDDEDNMETLTAYLEYFNYTVIKAVDGEEALNKIQSDKPDVVVLDMSIPKIDGWEVARRLRLQPENKDLTVIAFSAMALPHEMERAIKAGCDAFLTKPMSPEILIEEIKKILEEKKKA